MESRLVTGPLGVLLLTATACLPGEEPTTANTVAEAFGLFDGRAMHYAVDQGAADTEDHEFSSSSSYAERTVFTRTERTQGFIRPDADGTAAVTDLETTADRVQMVARGDCLPRCLDFDPPVVVSTFPWKVGDRQETSTTATIHEQGGDTQRQERHVFTVATESSVSTEAGDFEVYEISWQRQVDEEAVEYAYLYLAPEVGLVEIDRFDGAILRLRSYDP